jgi:hypothetical protein
MAKKDDYEYEKDSKKEYGEDTYDSSSYEDHEYVTNLLSASQEADQDLTKTCATMGARLRCSWISVMGSGSLTGTTTQKSQSLHATALIW